MHIPTLTTGLIGICLTSTLEKLVDEDLQAHEPFIKGIVLAELIEEDLTGMAGHPGIDEIYLYPKFDEARPLETH